MIQPIKGRRKCNTLGFRSERERLLYLFKIVTDQQSITCLNEVLDKMNESYKEMILVILDEKE
jgi:hypothetical protein